MSGSIIEIEDISVAYRIYPRPIDQLKEVVLGGVRHETFWALRNVSLKVREGERVGILGSNGAGKSTLLKTIVGTLRPAAGRVTTRGRVSSLLSLVPAWNGEDTGVENIRFNLTLAGVPAERLGAIIEDIADFTELGPFLHHPVKTYSSGMGARLSFAIATATDPDILIVDEILGTGDGYFAWKAASRMKEFCARGRALLFVSHSLPAIQSMCERGVWIQNGAVRMDGPIADVLGAYETDIRRADDEAMRRNGAFAGISRAPDVSEITDASMLRVRVVPRSYAPFYATHYIARIGVGFDGRAPAEIPLEPEREAAGRLQRLDVTASEWGRLHEKGGRVCRTLARIVGRNHGGQILVPRPPAGGGELTVELEFASTDPREELQAEFLDMAIGVWRPLERVDARSGGAWRCLAFRGVVDRTDEATQGAVAERIAEAAKADVEILSVVVADASGDICASVRERMPFEVRVRVRFNRSPELADVGIKLVRADGVYVFWQSSGQAGANVERPVGELEFRFTFDPNVFGAGDYFVNAHITNGWRFPDNYPYAIVYARKVNAAGFRIAPEMAGLDFGAVNLRVPVEMRDLGEG